MKYTTADEAVKLIKSNQRVFIHSAAATPNILVAAMVKRHEELRDVEICHMHVEGVVNYVKPEYVKSFKTNNFFIGANVRNYINKTRTQYVPVFLSEIPLLFKRNILPIDVAIIQVSPPDIHGFCSLGVSVDISKTAIDVAPIIIAHVNPQMPRTHGDGMIHCSRITAAIYEDIKIYEHNPKPLNKEEILIGKHVASLIEDGATLQMGIGGIPNAVLESLEHHKNLGVHTEMFADGIVSLVEKGVINGSNKKTHPGKIVSTFALGSRRLYDFMNDNPQVAMLNVLYTNDTSVIRKNPKVTAINSAIEIDLTGQICADSIGSKMYSGVGGQMDFIRGAALSEGGKPIFALQSITNKGESKIVPFLKEGAGVVTTRAHVHYVVTEYGIANLFGKNLQQRAKALIDIAHPNHRETLLKQAFERFGSDW